MLEGISPLSYKPGFELNQDGILVPISVNKGAKNDSPQKTGVSSYTSDVRTIVCQTIEADSMRFFCNLAGGKRAKGKPYDIYVPNGDYGIEAKTGRIGSSAVIRRGQLDKLPDTSYYGILYYKMPLAKHGPSLYVKRALENGRNPAISLRRNIEYKVAYLIPVSSIINFYNSSDLKEFRTATNGKFKALSQRSTQALYERNPDQYNQSEDEVGFKSHKFPLFRLG